VKGDLTDDLQIQLDGKKVATLTYQEYILLTVASLKSLITAAEGGISSSTKLTNKEERDEHLTKLKAAAERGVLLVAQRARLDDDGKKDLQEWTGKLGALADHIEDSEAKKALAAAIGLIKTLAGHYAIVAIVPKFPDAQRHVLDYERYQLPSLKLAGMDRPHRWLRDRIAALLGVRPVYLELDLSNAATAKSFHLMVVGPEGTYLGWQSMPHSDVEFKAAQTGNGISQPYKRFQRRRGQRYLHLYMRDVKRTAAARLKLSVKFYELPPGSMASATLAATGSFFLVYLVATISGRHPAPQGVSFTAVLLAFPAIIGLFAGFESRSTGLVSGTLSSRASSLTTIVVSILAMGLLVAQSAGSIGRTEHKAILGVGDRWWQCIVLISLVNILYALYVWITRTAYFYWLADRPDDQPQRDIGGARWFT
jgi:hypothetical protein